MYVHSTYIYEYKSQLMGGQFSLFTHNKKNTGSPRTRTISVVNEISYEFFGLIGELIEVVIFPRPRQSISI